MQTILVLVNIHWSSVDNIHFCKIIHFNNGDGDDDDDNGDDNDDDDDDEDDDDDDDDFD